MAEYEKDQTGIKENKRYNYRSLRAKKVIRNIGQRTPY
jgi:hypothetical protein